MSTPEHPPASSRPGELRTGEPTSAELRDLAELARRLDQARRARTRRGALVLALLLVVATGLWFTRAHWLPHVVSNDPYQSTPAQSFPVGAAGITVPPPTQLPDMPAERVGEALATVKRALEASYLDQRMLTGHDPGPLLSLLAPDSASVVRTVFDDGGYGTAMVRLAPGVTLAAPPRVNGKITFAQVSWRGMPALQVESNYVWAYALRGEGGGGPSGVVVIHSQTSWMFPLGKNLLPSSRGMYLGQTTGYWQGMDCAASQTGLTAPAPAHDRNANPHVKDSDPDAYFDPNRSVRVAAGCR